MATNQVTLVHVDEDYIDMELSSSPSNFSYSITSPPYNREFEFQMSNSVTKDKDSTTSPADDLFYKGKLLPLHLPPRLEMVQNLLENSNTTFEYLKSDTPLEDLRITPSTTNSTTPLESCNISPSESYRVSSEISPDEIPFGWSSSFVNDLPKKTWPKKLKQMKQSLLGQKLKASRNYIKALFNKSGCSDKSCATDAAHNLGEPLEKKPKCKNCYTKIVKKNNNSFEGFCDEKQKMISCAVIRREMLEDDFSIHRRSFSGVVQRHCAIKSSSLLTSSSGSSSSSSSSSFSFSSAGYYDLQLFKRSISANYELEGSIEGAIAHCKESQKNCSSKTSSYDNRNFPQFGTKIPIVENQELATLAGTIV